jgi:hypothetical protein
MADKPSALADKQPAIVVQLDGELHVLSVVDIRRLAAGLPYSGNKSKLIQVLATALKNGY